MFDLFILLLFLGFSDNAGTLWELQEYLNSHKDDQYRSFGRNNTSDVVRDLASEYHNRYCYTHQYRMDVWHAKGDALNEFADLWDEYVERNAA